MSARDEPRAGREFGRVLGLVEAERLLLREFGRMAAAYDRYSVTSRPVVWREIRKLLPNLRGRRALDLACGTGAHATRLARATGPAGSVVGIDAAEGMIRYARHKSGAHRRKNLQFLVMDSRRLKFPARSFDFVLSTFGFAYYDRRRCLREVLRILKEGGLFLHVGWHGANPESKVFVDALTELRGRNPPPADVRRLALARQRVSRLPENRSRKGKLTLAAELRRRGFRHVHQVVRAVTARFRDPAAYVRYKATWGEYERDLRRLSRRERQDFVEDIARRMRWSPAHKGFMVTWNLAFTFGWKP